MKDGLKFVYNVHKKTQFLLHREHGIFSLETTIDKCKWKNHRLMQQPHSPLKYAVSINCKVSSAKS